MKNESMKEFKVYTLDLAVTANVGADSKKSAFDTVLKEFDKLEAAPESGVNFTFRGVTHFVEEVFTLEGDRLSLKERSCSCQDSFEDEEIVCPHCGEIQ
jgi:hypothetical protein